MLNRTLFLRKLTLYSKRIATSTVLFVKVNNVNTLNKTHYNSFSGRHNCAGSYISAEDLLTVLLIITWEQFRVFGNLHE